MINSQKTNIAQNNKNSKKDLEYNNSGNEMETIIELSIVMPCLNEIRTLPICIKKA